MGHCLVGNAFWCRPALPSYACSRLTKFSTDQRRFTTTSPTNGGHQPQLPRRSACSAYRTCLCFSSCASTRLA